MYACEQGWHVTLVTRLHAVRMVMKSCRAYYMRGSTSGIMKGGGMKRKRRADVGEGGDMRICSFYFYKLMTQVDHVGVYYAMVYVRGTAYNVLLSSTM